MSKQLEDLTPVHVRGKRSTKRPIKPKRERLATLAVSTTQPASTLPNKRRKVHLSRLEDLPTEVLEIIFLHSQNLDLPMVSKALASQLSSRHLYRRMLDEILTPFLVDQLSKPDDLQLSTVESMFNRRFCSLDLFSEWLYSLPKRKLTGDYPFTGNAEIHAVGQAQAKNMLDNECPILLLMLLVSNRLPRVFRLPSKLLQGPWTNEKLNYLQRCSGLVIRSDIDATERARLGSFEGLRDAVKEQSVRGVHTLLDLCIVPEPDLLRVAVIDAGCNRSVVNRICEWYANMPSFANNGGLEMLDPLDPVLWAWTAERAQQENGNGEFVRSWLRSLGESM